MRILIIIVTYNGLQWLPECLKSASRQSVPVDLFIVDNNSTDGTTAYIQKTYPDIIFISSAQNLGFGRANNLGINYALKHHYDYVFLLNQDAYLEPDTIEKLIKIQKLNPAFGILSPMQYNGQGDALDHNFKLNFENRSNCNLYKDAVLPTGADFNLFSVHFVMAAMWLISLDCLKKVGEFDEIFSHYGEDNDYLNRARFHKFKIGIVEPCKGYHDRAFRQVSPVKALDITFAGYRAMLTDLNREAARAFLFVMRAIVVRLAKSLLRGDFKLATVIIAKAFSLFSGTFRILKRRKINTSYYLNPDV